MQPKTIMMHHRDAGWSAQNNRAIFDCEQCGYESGWITNISEHELLAGKPCPQCNDALPDDKLIPWE